MTPLRRFLDETASTVALLDCVIVAICGALLRIALYGFYLAWALQP